MRDYDEYKDAEEILDEDEEEDEEESAPRKRSGAILPLAGGTLVTTEIISAIIHGGPLGVGAGLLASAFVWLKGQDLIDGMSEIVDLSALAGHLPRTKGGRSFKDRLTGHYPEETVDYEPYITSPEWKARARQIRKRDGYACQDCGATDKPLDVHHLTYERLGNELDEDLITLCRECHDARHNEEEEDEQPKSRVSDVRARDLDYGAGDELEAPTFVSKGPLYFSQVLKTFTPSLNKIYLATLPDGKPVFKPARDLCHTALAGTTRGGKDHIIRCLMSQLCYAGAKVYLLDPNYTRYDLESVDPFGRPYPEDWTPFDAYLRNDPREMIHPDSKYQVIEHYLKLAFDMVERRLESRGSGIRLGAPQFLFVNELPAIVEEVPKTGAYLKKILREGAKVGVFLVNASQDFHVSTIFKEIGGGVRKCYRTAFDVGSDSTTQKALGLLPLKGLGKGNGSLRCDGILSDARLAYVDNEALYTLLGPSTYVAQKQRPREDDDLATYKDDPITDPPVRTARPDAMKLYAAGERLSTRKQDREQRLRSTAPVQVSLVAHPPEVAAQDDPESSLDRDERAVLAAYRSGLKTGNAIAAETGLSSTRVNQVLNKLARRNLIDWQPRKA